MEKPPSDVIVTNIFQCAACDALATEIYSLPVGGLHTVAPRAPCLPNGWYVIGWHSYCPRHDAIGTRAEAFMRANPPSPVTAIR